MTQTQTQVKDTPLFSQTSWLEDTVYKEQKEASYRKIILNQKS